MSVQAMGWVIDHSRHKGGDLLCLLMIANHAHADGTNAFPSFATLARECRMSRRQTIRMVDRLLESGELSVETGAGPGGVNRYRVNMVASDIVTPPSDITMSLPETPASEEMSPLLVTQLCHSPSDILSTASDTAMSPKPIEPSLNRPMNHQASSPPLRARDIHWDALVEIHEYEPLKNTPDHGRFNKACAIWRALKATPEEMHLTYRLYDKQFPNAARTVSAVSSHAQRLLTEYRKRIVPITDNGKYERRETPNGPIFIER